MSSSSAPPRVGMVVYLIPGLMNTASATPNTFAEVYPHWYSKIFHSGDVVSLQEVQRAARQQLQQYPQYADNPMILNFLTQQAGQRLVQQQILLTEAGKLGITRQRRRRPQVPAHRHDGRDASSPTASTLATRLTPI